MRTGKITISVDLAVDLLAHLRVCTSDEPDDVAAMRETLGRIVNASGEWPQVRFDEGGLTTQGGCGTVLP